MIRKELRSPYSLILFSICLILLPTTSCYPGFAASIDEPFFEKPAEIELTSLLSQLEPSESVLIERADAADPYRIPGKGVIINPWYIDGKNYALATVTPFPNFALLPSFLALSSNKSGRYSATLSPCFKASQLDCIESLAVTNNGSTIQARPYVKVPSLNVFQYFLDNRVPIGANENFASYTGDASINLPSGGDSWLWKFSGDSKLYAASINFTGYLSNAQELSKMPSLKYPIVKIQLVPVDIDGPVCREPNSSGCAWSNIDVGMDGAIYNNSEVSLRRSLFSMKGTFSLGFRTSVPWTSWMIGTVADLQLETQELAKGYRYRVSGRPSEIPSARKSIPLTSENHQQLLELSEGQTAGASNCPHDPECSPNITLGGRNDINASTFEKLEQLELLTDKMATHSVTAWILMSAVDGGPGDSRALPVMTCMDKVGLKYPAGASVSNATLFEKAPPQWDKVDRSFTYRVGAFHLTRDGLIQEGDYSFLISKEIAQCLWGSKLSPSSIRVEIVNGNVTSTVISSESQANSNWVRFRASGFHFSSPKFVVREAQVANKAPAAAPRSIVCMKGKTTKKVTGISPKCPKGFKKKA